MNIEQWLGKENQLGIDIWKKKYQQNNESFDEWLDRVSGGNEEIRQLIVEKKFLFGGRILSNRGMATNDRKLTYSNCYVITPPEDNIESIFECAGKLARTFSYGGGCGIDISKLSPRGAQIRNSAKETTGSVSFMELYNLVTDLIGQNGRRGALMLSLGCDHPDLQEFISVKNDLNKITKANISVRVSDEFMNAVLDDEFYRSSFIRQETGEEVARVVVASKIFKQLCENNWNFGEPGILYWDNIKRWNLLSNNKDFEYAGVNPCAEEPLPAGGSCLLGSINLAEFVTDDKEFDIYAFQKTVMAAVRALNEVLDEGLMLHPLKEQQDSVRDWRQIGLGVFGIADMLIKMGYEYGSKESLNICEMIAEEMIDTAIWMSGLLAKEFGPYPKYDKMQITNNPFFIVNAEAETGRLVDMYGLRNSQLLTIAPTGSLSTMLGVSGGIEPIYDTHYIRKTMSLHGHEEDYIVYTPIVKQYMEENDISDVKDLPDFFATSKTIDPMKRIEMQAVWQRYIDASISSTVNLPEAATVEDVEKLYIYAWERGLKGLTIFRENCARTAILSSTPAKKEDEPSVEEEDIIAKPEVRQLDTLEPLTREELGCRLNGSTYVKEVACGHLYITINRDENDNLVEVFIDPGKSGGCVANAECLGRYASACMRAGMTIDSIVDVTKGVKCSACSQAKGSKIKHIDGLSCGDVVARTIQEEYNRYKHDKKTEIAQPKKTETKPKQKENVCPECGEGMNAEGGCVICKNCGYSKCD